MMRDVLAVVLAGGKGSRLEPLTRDRAKPAVPFGGPYRIIDFTLSNCINSDVRKILLLTQYKAMSLDRHINLGWRGLLSRELGEFIDVVPPQQRIDEQWYQGTADAVYQNIYTLEKERPKYVVILAGDHIYKMNYRNLVGFHVEKKADLTIAALRVSREAARSFGVMQIDTDGRIRGFEEKPDDPKTIPGDDRHALASMGIYVFTARFLFEQLCLDATRPESAHDFGRNIIPSIIDNQRVFAYPFLDENRKADAYWRDVGTLDAYFEANMDLVQVDPLLNMYDAQWPIRTYLPNFPPPKFVFNEEGEDARRGEAHDSIVCQGSIVSGGHVVRSLLGPNTRVNSYARVEDSILFEGVDIGRHAKVRRAIIDKGVHIPPHFEIGYDPEADAARGFTISPGGVVVIAKADGMEHFMESAPAKVGARGEKESAPHGPALSRPACLRKRIGQIAAIHRDARFQPHGAAQILRRCVRLRLLEKGDAEAVVGGGVVFSQGNRAAKVGDGRLGIARQQSIAKAQMRLRQLRVEIERLTETAERLLAMAKPRIGQPEVVQRLCKIRLQLKRPFQVPGGLLPLALPVKGHAEIVTAAWAIRIQFDRTPQVPLRPAEVPQLQVRIAEVAMRFGILRVQLDRFAEERHGRAILLLVQPGFAQVVIGDRVVRSFLGDVRPQRLAVGINPSPQPARPSQRNGRGNHQRSKDCAACAGVRIRAGHQPGQQVVAGKDGGAHHRRERQVHAMLEIEMLDRHNARRRRQNKKKRGTQEAPLRPVPNASDRKAEQQQHGQQRRNDFHRALRDRPGRVDALPGRPKRELKVAQDYAGLRKCVAQGRHILDRDHARHRKPLHAT